MIEVIIGSALILGTTGLGIAVKHASSKFQKISDEIEDTIMEFVTMHNLEEYDYELHDVNGVESLKKNVRDRDGIKFVAENIGKGYDFVTFNIKKGWYYPPHRHNQSNEFFYIINGKLELSYCSKHDDCDERAERVVLKSGDYFLISAGDFHYVKALQNTKYIVVALPTLWKDKR